MVEYISLLLLIIISTFIIVTRASGVIVFLVLAFGYLALYANNIIERVLTKFVSVSGFSGHVSFIILCGLLVAAWYTTKKTVAKEKLLKNILPSIMTALLFVLIVINKTSYLPLDNFKLLPKDIIASTETVLVGGLLVCLLSLWLSRHKPEKSHKKHGH